MEEKELQLVNYEQAKRLKELGFDWKCLCYYIEDNDKYDFFDFITIKKENTDCTYPFEVLERDHNKKEGNFSAPTVALALKWMRNEKNIQCGVFYEESGYPKPAIYYCGRFQDNVIAEMHTVQLNTYEEAESALLDELLTILEKEKEHGDK
jgi:hypothetical protein